MPWPRGVDSPIGGSHRGCILTVTPSASLSDRRRLAESFSTALEAESLSLATIRLYAHGIRRLYAYLDRVGLDVPFSSISAEHLREWMNAERKAGASPATLEILHRALRRFWRFLREEGEVTEDVAARLPSPRVPVKVVKALTSEQVAALFRACQRDKSLLGLRDHAICATLLDTGLRASELLRLTVEGIDRKERRALVMGKGARERLTSFEAATHR